MRNAIAELSAYGRASPGTLASVATFALLSIRRQFSVLGDAIAAEARGELLMLAMVDRGVRYVRENASALHAAATAATSAEQCVQALLPVPGMGLVKAGFVAQMLGHDVGCIDSNNLRMFEVPRSAVRFDKGCRPTTAERRVTDYVAMCRRLGGSERLWEVWCEYVAGVYPETFTSGQHVSEYHVECVQRVGVPF